MHLIQRNLLNISSRYNLADLRLRTIARLVGAPHPQQVKHHLDMLKKNGLLDENNKPTVEGQSESVREQSENLLRIPLVGSANCGPATIFADQNIVDYLQVSPSVLSNRSIDNLFALKAVGESMNQALIDGESINDGDFVIVDSSNQSPDNGDCVVSVINGCANIKKYYLDGEREQIVLFSESSSNLPPIIIKESDNIDYLINGVVIKVIKGNASYSKLLKQL